MSVRRLLEEAALQQPKTAQKREQSLRSQRKRLRDREQVMVSGEDL